jgi:hypothetical protein
VNTKEIPPAVIIASIVIVVIILGVVGWRMMAPKTYSGPPVDMGKMMGAHQSGGAPPRQGPPGAMGGQPR